jgi:hypothetical protein
MIKYKLLGHADWSETPTYNTQLSKNNNMVMAVTELVLG